MPNARDALVEVESSGTPISGQQLTANVDRTRFESNDGLWSRRAGSEPAVLPDGLINGGEIVATAANNQVSVTASMVNLSGLERAVTANNALTVARPITDPVLIHSITVNSSGDYEVVSGSEGTTITETRGATGGPPFIPVGSIEVGQVRLNGTAAAPVSAAEIFTAPGIHRARFDFPAFNIDFLEGAVDFSSELPQIHVGNETKQVFASYTTAVFTALPNASNFVPAEESVSVNSEQVYGNTVASTNVTLNQGSFDVLLNNGLTDLIVQLRGQNLWFRFRQSRFQPANYVVQGILGIARQFPADNNISSSCTISPEVAGQERSS